MCQQSTSLGFTDEVFPHGTHMCYFYNDEEERREIISKYLASGLAAGEKTLYFAKDIPITALLDNLDNLGVDIESEQNKGNFEVQATKDVYHSDGIFDPDRQLAKLHQYYANTLEQGYPGARVGAEMHWALEDIKGADRLLEYETRWNEELKRSPVTAICQYNTHLFDGNTVMQVLRVHPLVITNGQVVRNPFYSL